MRTRGRRSPLAAASLLTLASVFVAAPGCQKHERSPLDVDAARAALASRLPTDETARAYAARLAAAAGRETGFDPTDGLSLAEAEPVVLVFNRELRLARLEASVTLATAEHAGLWEDPTLGVDLEHILRGVSDPWIIAATVGITLPISGRLEAEKARAGAAHGADLEHLAAQEWAARTELRASWMEWSAGVERCRLAEELVGRLSAVVELGEAQVRGGVIAAVDASLFGVELTGREADLMLCRLRVRELELALRDSMGLSPDALVELVPTMVFVPRSADAAAIRAAIDSDNPGLAALRADYSVAEEARKVEIRKQYPDLTIGPGAKVEDGDPRLLLGLSLPLPLWNRNQRGVAEATVLREVGRAKFESLHERLESELAATLARYQTSRDLRAVIESRLLPLADEQDRTVRRIVELGRVEALLILETLKLRHEAKLRLIDALAAEATSAIRLDALLGPARSPRPESASESSVSIRLSEGGPQ